MAVDFDKVKRNIQRMMDGGASESEIDEYIQSEGTTADELRSAPAIRPPLPKGDRLDRPPQKPSELQATAGGFLEGALAGWDDEAAATLGIKPFEGGWDRQYANNLERIRNAKRAEQEAHPGWYTTGQVGGAIAPAVVPGLNVARAASMPMRVLAGTGQGAAYGGAYAAGAADGSAAERAAAVPQGAFWGGLGGAGGTAAFEGIAHGARALSPVFTTPFRGVLAPEREAARRVGLSLDADDAIAQPRLTPQDEAAAVARGQPVLNIDRGGEATRALARSAANTSPQARAALNMEINDRFETQGGRVTDLVRHIVGGRSTVANRDQLQAAARRANAPAYRAAYSAGDMPINSPELERLMTSPDVAAAMQAAARKGKNTAVAEGHGGFNAAVQVTPDGRVIFQRTPGGMPTYPNLQFWDYTYRALRDAGREATRRGAADEGATITTLSRAMRDELDRMVPTYRNARSTAAQFFDAEDALEAGDNFVRSRVSNDEARAAINQMSPAERQLFAEGFADRLVREVNELRGRQNIINQAFVNSPASRERIELALGPQRARELESLLRVEAYLDMARQAVQGNSTTTRQLAELTLAGGVGAVASGGNIFDPKFLLTTALVRGGRAGMQAIDSRVAQRVGQLLASNDPRLVQQGVRMIANNNALFEAVRALDVPAATMGSQAAVNQTRPPSVVMQPRQAQPAMIR